MEISHTRYHCHLQGGYEAMYKKEIVGSPRQKDKIDRHAGGCLVHVLEKTVACSRGKGVQR